MISLIGTGYKDTGRQIVKFSFAGHETNVEARYDDGSDCFHAVTPNFEQFKTVDGLPLSWP